MKLSGVLVVGCLAFAACSSKPGSGSAGGSDGGGGAGGMGGGGGNGGGTTVPLASPVYSALPVATSPADEVGLADFNGDGKLDVVATSVSGVSYEVLLGSGDGMFAGGVSGAQFGFGPAIADVDGNGTPDFTLVYSSINTLVNGGTSFTDQNSSVMSQSGLTGVLAVDLNADTMPDLVVSTHPYLATLINGGSVSYTMLQYCSQIAAGDFNGDGKVDLAVLDADTGPPEMTILAGNGLGALQKGAHYSVDNPNSLAIGDLNGDGKPDIVAAAGPSLIGVFIGNGDGTFTSGKTFGTSGQGQEIGSLALADLDGDAHLDLVAMEVNGGGFAILHGNGDATFALPLAVQVDTADRVRAQALAIGDVNGDGKPDIVIAAGMQIATLLHL